MPDDVMTDAVADSSPAIPDASPATPPAGAQNTGSPAPEAQVPFHQHPRWQQLMQERATDRQTIAQMHQQLAEFQRFQHAAAPKSEEEMAREALHRLDPNIPKYGDRLQQVETMLNQLVQHQQQVLTTQGKSQLAEMAKTSGLPDDPVSRAIVENAVSIYLAQNPEAVARFKNHDLSVLKDAFQQFNDGFLGKLRREPLAQVAETKIASQRLPPRSASGAPPGPAAPQKVTAANERDVRDGMRDRLSKLLMGPQE